MPRMLIVARKADLASLASTGIAVTACRLLEAGGGDPRQSHNWCCQRKHRPAPRSQGMLTEVTLRDVAQRNFIIAREDEVVFNIMTRMARRGASIAVVVKGRGRPYASHVTAGSHRRFRRRKYQSLHRITEPAMTRVNRVFPSYEKLFGRCRADRSALAHHIRRPARRGPWVLIGGRC